jgi:hypothetical protein
VLVGELVAPFVVVVVTAVFASFAVVLVVSELWRTGLMGWLGPRSGSVIGT